MDEAGIFRAFRLKELQAKTQMLVVLVKNEKIIQRARTSFNGVHAEQNAINSISDASVLKNLLYITLEPCAHLNEEGISCADLIVKVGSEVIISNLDPVQELQMKFNT